MKLRIVYLSLTAVLSIGAGLYKICEAIISDEYLPKDDLLLAGLFLALGLIFLLLGFDEYKIYKEKKK